MNKFAMSATSFVENKFYLNFIWTKRSAKQFKKFPNVPLIIIIYA